MIATHLSIDGFGGLKKFSEPLTPITLVVGNNGSGKTTILDAISIALLGSVPRLGAKDSKTRGRMSSKLGTIGLTMDVGSVTTTFPPKGAAVVVAKGAMPKIDPMVVDINRLFDMTGPQRVRFLLELSSAKVPQPQDVVDELYADTFTKHQVPREEWDLMVKPVFESFLGVQQESLEWLVALQAKAALAKAEAGSLGPLRDMAAKLEAEAASAGAAAPVDRSADLRKLATDIATARQEFNKASSAYAVDVGQASTLRAEAVAIRKQAQDKPARKCPTCGAGVAAVSTQQSVKDSLLANAVAKETQAAAVDSGMAPKAAVLAEAKAKVDMLVVQETQLRQVQHVFVTAQGAALQLEKIRLQVDELSAKADVLSGLPGWLNKYQARILDESLKPICSMASLIVRERFDADVVIEGGDFSMKRGETVVPLEFVSGFENVLASIGIQVALMQRSPFKIVLADELGRADQASMEALLSIVTDLIEEGVLHQFVGTTPEYQQPADSELQQDVSFTSAFSALFL